MAKRLIKKKKTAPPIGRILYRTLVICSAIIVVGYGVYWYLTRPPEISDGDTSLSTDVDAPTIGSTTTGDDNDPAVTPTPEPTHERKEYTYTFLLAASDQSSGNTDTMMVATYDTVNQTVGLASIPRDTLIEGVRESTGNSFYKLNSMYAYNGPEALMETVGDMLGYPIDYYVRVSTYGFVQLVDAVGGVEFYVPVTMNFDDPTQDLHIHYTQGTQWLSGSDALNVARCRQNSDGEGEYPDNLYPIYGDSDIGRTGTQRDLLTTVIKKAITQPTKFTTYFEIFEENVTTNLGVTDLTYFASKALEFDFTNGLTTSVFPGDGSVTYKGWTWCYELDPEGVLDIVNNGGLNPYTTDITMDMLDIVQS